MNTRLIALAAVLSLALTACVIGEDDSLLVESADFAVENPSPAEGATTTTTTASGSGAQYVDLFRNASNGGTLFTFATIDGDEWNDVGIDFAPINGAIALTKSGSCVGSQNANPSNNWAGGLRITFRDPSTGQPALAENVAIDLVNPPVNVKAYDGSGAVLSDQNLAGFSGTVTVSQAGIDHIDITGDFYCMQNSITFDLCPACTDAPTVDVADVQYMTFPRTWVLEDFSLSDCATVTDSCDGPLDIDVAGTITSIDSDEFSTASANHDCDAEPEVCTDIKILGSSSFQLRNNRDSYLNGRVYTVHFDVTDSAGNTSSHSCEYGVRLWGTQIPVADPPAYSVTP